MRACWSVPPSHVPLSAPSPALSLHQFGTGLTNLLILLRQRLTAAPLLDDVPGLVPSDPLIPVDALATLSPASDALMLAAADASALLSNAAASTHVAAVASSLGDVSMTAASAVADVASNAAVAASVAAAPPSVEVPILATSLAYGVYMAVSSNLR